MAGESPLPRSVLVVDDEPVVLEVLKVALKKGGYTQVTLVNTAEAAFAALEKEQFGALLTDKNLPDRNGLEVIKEARRLYPYCACLVMTGYASTESVIEALRLGANDYLEKPFNELGLVLQRLKSALDHQRVVFERAALAEGIRYMEQTLKSRDKEVFAHRTELEMLQHVLDVKIEDALAPVKGELATAKADKAEVLERLAQKLQRDAHLAEGLLVAARRCLEAGRNPELTIDAAKQMLAEVEARLAAHADSLKG